MNNRRFFIPIMLVILIAFVPTEAQPLVTDRPDQTESSSVVPEKSLQIESGVIFEKDQFTAAGQRIDTESFTIASTLLRFGLNKKIELRVNSEFKLDQVSQNGQTNKFNGVNGVGIGAKLFLAHENGYLPESAVIIDLNLPIGEEEYVGNDATPRMLFTLSHTLSDIVSVGYNLGGEWFDNSMTLIYSGVVGFALMSNMGYFLEFYGNTASGQQSAVQFDTGLTLLLQSNLQFDLSFGVALEHISPDYFIGAGLSYRIPK